MMRERGRGRRRERREREGEGEGGEKRRGREGGRERKCVRERERGHVVYLSSPSPLSPSFLTGGWCRKKRHCAVAMAASLVDMATSHSLDSCLLSWLGGREGGREGGRGREGGGEREGERERGRERRGGGRKGRKEARYEKTRWKIKD